MQEFSSSPPHLFLVHGGPGMDDSYFSPLVDAIKGRVKTTSYTQKSAASLGINGLVAELISVLNIAAKNEAVYLLGHSFGAMLAIQALSTTLGQGKLKGLILSNWAFDRSWLKPFRANHGQRMDSLKIPGGLTPDESYRYEMESLADLYFPSNRLEKGLKVIHECQFRADIRETVGAEFLADLDLTAALPSIDLPVLSLTGEFDQIIAPNHSFDGSRLLPNAQHQAISQAGHFPFIDQPNEFADKVLEFIETTERRRL